MREDWKYERLLDACDVYQPATISTKQLVENGEFDVFGANGKIGKYSSYNHEEPEVLLTCRGATCGNINVSTPKSWINGNAMVVHPKEKNLLKNYLVYLLKTLNYTEVITGSAQPQITRLSLKNVYIPIPPLSEQERIVALLDDQFAKIDALKANADQQLKAAKDLFQSALKQLLTPREGWEEKELKDICKKPQNIKWSYNSGVRKYIDLTSVSRESLSIVDSAEIDYANAPSRAKQIIKEGDIIFATTRPTLRRVCRVTEEFDDQICSTGFCVLRPSATINFNFLFYSLNLDKFYSYIEPLQTGASYPAVTDSMVKSYSISFPPLSEQERIAARLDSISERVKALQTNYDQTINLCNDLKQSLLKSIFA